MSLPKSSSVKRKKPRTLRQPNMRQLALTWGVNALIAGVDEAGRGPLAGPVVAAAVILDDLQPIVGLADSKLLTERRRERLFDEIRARALCFSVAQASVEEIDALNILQATLLAMRRAVEGLRLLPKLVLVDGNRLPSLPMRCEAVVKGDALVAAISAASILAKVTRDRLCLELDQQYPGYGFAQHKGYGTAQHLAALKEQGACPQHRKSFRPVSEVAGIGRNPGDTMNVPTHISSRDNALLKDLRRLATGTTDYRKQGRFWAEGDHLVRAALARGVRRKLACFQHHFGLWRTAQYANAAIKNMVIADNWFADLSALESPVSAWVLCLTCRLGAASAAGRQRRSGPCSGRRQRRCHIAQCIGVWFQAGHCAQGDGGACGAPRCCVPAWGHIGACSCWNPLIWRAGSMTAAIAGDQFTPGVICTKCSKIESFQCPVHGRLGTKGRALVRLCRQAPTAVRAYRPAGWRRVAECGECGGDLPACQRQCC
jgi:ribonuclease HII